MAVIEAHDVRKTYRRRGKKPKAALDGLELVVEEGGVHGFLGPNGSGKTTTLRCLLGLARADSGSMRLLGTDVPSALPTVVGDVGVLLESPAFFPAYTGRLNLRLLATAASLPEQRVDEVMELVGLRDAAAERVKGYSLGMRQRLGIAAALLKRPKLLVLDEPSNGLDPAGMKEVRELLRRLGDDDVTVFLSSHLLAEVQQICDDVTILARGKYIAGGRVADVLAAQATGAIRVGIGDAPRAAQVLRAAGFQVTDDGQGLLVDQVPDGAVVVRTLAEQQLYVSWLMPVQADLEQAFLNLTEGSGLDEGGPA
ncbi:MAG: ATP-binding cassette domain-containing protein [Actinomycetota bacterium]|nr:ATP-binding cassette domain-containing protein [Actinomycetota bacterium]